MLSSPTATQRRPVHVTPRRSTVVKEAGSFRQCRPSDESRMVPPEPTATQRPAAVATPRRISSVGLGTPTRPPASVPSRIAPKSPTATTRLPAAASCHSRGRGAVVLSVAIGLVTTGVQVIPSLLASTVDSWPLNTSDEPTRVPPHRMTSSRSRPPSKPHRRAR